MVERTRFAPLLREQRACAASVGRGWGWGPFLEFVCFKCTLTPNPSPQVGGERTEFADCMISRRELVQLAAATAACLGANWTRALAQQKLGQADLLRFEPLGNVTIVHIADLHAQLLPVLLREPSSNIGVGASKGQVPHLSGPPCSTTTRSNRIRRKPTPSVLTISSRLRKATDA